MEWQVRMSASRGTPYFYNEATKESRWLPPDGMDPSEVAALPGSDLLTRSGASAPAPSSVQASHILVKHRGSRRPASWKEPSITRSKEEAISILQKHESVLRPLPSDQRKQKFGEIATTESDCSSHANAGDLGRFSKGQMQKPFEEAAFSLQVGEMSNIVETDSGVHLILRAA